MGAFLRLCCDLPRLLIPAGAAILIACDATGPGTPRRFTLSVMNKSAGARSAVVSPTGVSADVRIGSGANSIQITKVEFVLAEIQLSQAGPCSNTHENEDDDDCDELDLDPILVDLSLDGSPPKKVLDAVVPAGTYTQLQAELHAVRADTEDDEDNDEKVAATFLASHPSWPSGVSVRVAGVYTDAGGATHDFTFTSRVSAELEMDFPSPITVGDQTTNLTLTVDVGSWFKNAAGAVIDPTNGANANAINANIRRSFKALEDDDQDGEDDDR